MKLGYLDNVMKNHDFPSSILEKGSIPSWEIETVSNRSRRMAEPGATVIEAVSGILRLNLRCAKER
jgi:hypothetical protein